MTVRTVYDVNTEYGRENHMATALKSPNPPLETVGQLLRRLGDISPERIRLHPAPGTATVKDVIIALESQNKRLFELADGVLVEKDMALRESVYAERISHRINDFLDEHDLGFTAGADGAMEILPGLVRIPDVSFIAWEDLEGDDIPDAPVPELVPRLAVEVISKGNTPLEMERKLRDYFEAGVRLVWLVYPKTQTAESYTSPTSFKRIGKNQSLVGGVVLPGFKLPLPEIFRRSNRRRS